MENVTQLRFPQQGRIPSWFKTYPAVATAALCALLTLLGWLALVAGQVGGAVWILLIAYGIGGYESAREGLTTLWQERELDVDLLMIVAALGAATLGLWQREYYLLVDGAILILIFAISGALEDIALQRTERNIRSLMQLTPDTAWRWQGGQTQRIKTQQLQVGDRILIKPGELIPTDGVVQTGSSTVNQATLTGESIPVEKGIGDEVFGGTLNGSGAITVELHQPPESSLIQRVIRLVEQAKTSQPRSQLFLEKFERGYARLIVGVGLLLAIMPPLLLAWSWETTIYRALIFLVVASPCALMAAIMPTLLSGIAQGARQGILFKDGAQLETMGRIEAIAFDKTGTLTTGVLQVSDLVPAAGVAANHVLQVAASLEAYSEHPIADAIVAEAQQQGLSLLSANAVQAAIGQGIVGHLAGTLTRIGKPQFVTADLSETADSHLLQASHQLEATGKTVIWVTEQQHLIGLLAVADQIRPQAAQVLAILKQLGIATVILTGDNAATAQTLAQLVAVEAVYADLLPEDKVDAIEKLQQQYGTVAMVGDGINDAPALAQASVGIAMGTTGSDVALETADVVLMGDRLEKLTQAIGIGAKSQRIVKQNIALALTSIALLMVANFFGELTLPAGVLGHEGATLLVTLNGLRLLRTDAAIASISYL
ncbi:heavy metal translocating P-type ATPase [Acaryochloris thomasi]|nr:heavy metal translocating P-type ATPase [Acaryochloris thomasi]